MKKFTAVLEAYNEGQPLNPAVCTFHTDDGADDQKIGARIFAMFAHIAQREGTSAFRVREIQVSSGAGASSIVNIKGVDVNAAMLAANTLLPDQATTVIAPTSALYGTVLGNAYITMLPLGTSLLVTETASAGPKGRIFLPYPSPYTVTAQGVVSPTVGNNVAQLFAAYYGLLSDTGALSGPPFLVKSKTGSASIVGVRVSAKFAHLKSRTR